MVQISISKLYQLADTINKRWLAKLNEVKVKEKIDKYFQPANCDKLTVPHINAEIWDKLYNKPKHHDLRSASIQKSMTKIGSILGQSTEILTASCQLVDATQLNQIYTKTTAVKTTVPGQISLKLTEWHKITSDAKVLCTVAGEKLDLLLCHNKIIIKLINFLSRKNIIAQKVQQLFAQENLLN